MVSSTLDRQIEAVAAEIVSDSAQVTLNIDMSTAWALLVCIQDEVLLGAVEEPTRSRLVDLGWDLQSKIEARHPAARPLLNDGWLPDSV